MALHRIQAGKMVIYGGDKFLEEFEKAVSDEFKVIGVGEKITIRLDKPYTQMLRLDILNRAKRILDGEI